MLKQEAVLERAVRPRLGISMGDPAGVGPEIVLNVLNDSSIAEKCQLVVFGDRSVLERCANVTDQPFACRVESVESFHELARLVELARSVDQESPGDARRNAAMLGYGLQSGVHSTNDCSTNDHILVDCQTIAADGFTPGQVSAATGESSYRYIQHAIDAVLAGTIASVTTAPINKEALHAAGHKYPGHTEMFAERAGSSSSCMMQYSPEITCSFVTVHCGYAEVPKLLTVQRIVEVIELTGQAMIRLRGQHPRIVVCGLNPHAGEHGLFGDREEERIIVPAIEAARARGWDIEGPLPPDTVFIPAKRATTDAVVCMYHDQGHIPVKALAFDSAVNTTLGISIVRTSVDHGTACDIAWQGKARPHSLRAAIEVARRLVSVASHV